MILAKVGDGILKIPGVPTAPARVNTNCEADVTLNVNHVMEPEIFERELTVKIVMVQELLHVIIATAKDIALNVMGMEM